MPPPPLLARWMPRRRDAVLLRLVTEESPGQLRNWASPRATPARSRSSTPGPQPPHLSNPSSRCRSQRSRSRSSAVAPLLPQAQGADVYPPAIRLKPARRQVQPGEIVAPVVEQGGKEFSQFLPPLSQSSPSICGQSWRRARPGDCRHPTQALQTTAVWHSGGPDAQLAWMA
jgi:hypothetical protein